MLWRVQDKRRALINVFAYALCGSAPKRTASCSGASHGARGVDIGLCGDGCVAMGAAGKACPAGGYVALSQKDSLDPFLFRFHFVHING